LLKGFNLICNNCKETIPFEGDLSQGNIKATSKTFTYIDDSGLERPAINIKCKCGNWTTIVPQKLNLNIIAPKDTE
jgi:hypothetical protein